MGTNPRGATFDGTNVWVGDGSEKVIRRLDPVDGSVTLTVPTLAGRSNGHLVFDGSHIWVANQGDDLVERLDPATGQRACSASSGPGPYVLAFDGTHVWVGNTGVGSIDSITLLNDECETVSSFLTPDSPEFAVVDGTVVWIAFADSGFVQRRSLGGGLIGETIVSNGPRGIAVLRDNVWVANSLTNTITKIQRSTGIVIEELVVAPGPWDLKTDGVSVWVASSGANQLLKVDPETLTMEVFAVGLQPLNITSDGQSVWVTNFGDGTVSRVSGVVAGLFE